MIIDGREVPVASGASILDVARGAGIAIPTLCHHPALPPDGSCRMCLVEIDGRHGLHPACTMPAGDALDVRTDTEATRSARQNTLRLLLDSYRPGAGRSGNELLDLAARYGVASRATDLPSPTAVDDSNPFIRVDRMHASGAGVACAPAICSTGSTAIGVFGRDEAAHIGFGADGPMQDSACEFCGMCEAVCPTDALIVKLVHRRLMPEPERAASTVCGYCGVGCRLGLQLADGRIVGTSPDWRAVANHGLLCVKGRFGWAYVHAPGATHAPARPTVAPGWPRRRAGRDGLGHGARSRRATRCGAIRERHGGDAVGFLASAKCSNEENYLFQKLARQVFATNNVDHCARLCHSPTVVALVRRARLGRDDQLHGRHRRACAQSVFVDRVEHDRAAPSARDATPARRQGARAPNHRGGPAEDPAGRCRGALSAAPARDRHGVAERARSRADRQRLGGPDFIAGATEGFDAFAASVADDTAERAASGDRRAGRRHRRAAAIAVAASPGRAAVRHGHHPAHLRDRQRALRASTSSSCSATSACRAAASIRCGDRTTCRAPAEWARCPMCCPATRG